MYYSDIAIDAYKYVEIIGGDNKTIHYKRNIKQPNYAATLDLFEEVKQADFKPKRANQYEKSY